MKYGIILEPNDMATIVHEYQLENEIEEYDELSLRKIIATYFSVKPEAVVKTDHGFIVLNFEGDEL